jgi:hypothetical protein
MTGCGKRQQNVGSTAASPGQPGPNNQVADDMNRKQAEDNQRLQQEAQRQADENARLRAALSQKAVEAQKFDPVASFNLYCNQFFSIFKSQGINLCDPPHTSVLTLLTKDVSKTDSLTAPYTGTLTFKSQDPGSAVFEEYKMTFSYQGGRWELQTVQGRAPGVIDDWYDYSAGGDPKNTQKLLAVSRAIQQ